jgi:midasin
VGGRKSLPKSFLNRFNKIYLDDLSEADYSLIMTRKLSSTPELDVDMLLELARKKFARHPVYQAGDTPDDGRLNIRDLNRFLSIYKHQR